MAPPDVWVIYDKFGRAIVWVTAERFLAERKWEELCQEKPSAGFTPNKTKLLVCTLKRALDEIDAEHKAEMDYLREQNNQETSWQYQT
ncbi:MAG TPA: hypothetical protein VGD26_09545 [Chitinophagaceae bacterium]